MSTLDDLLVASGKVREIYDLGDDTLLLVASDRISAFDVILPTPIPDKGRVLTGMTRFWLERTSHIVANHMLGTAPAELPEVARTPELAGRSMLRARSSRCCRSSASCAATWSAPAGRTTSAPAPSAATSCPAGLEQAAEACRSRCSRRPPRPSSAPTTRTSPPTQGIALVGEAALPASSSAPRSRCTRFAADHAAARGIILADTKFEFGLDADGTLRAGRRGADARLLAVLAGRLVPHRHQPAELRQAVRARLPRDARLGQDGARPRAARRRPRRHRRRATAMPTSASRVPTSAPTSTRWE